MPTMYPEALESRGASAEEATDWLSVLTRRVASNNDFGQRKTWRPGTIDVAKRSEETVQLDQEGGDDEERAGLIASLISAVVANHGRAVKELMERTGADRTMEPLWHAVRADLGEEPGPLPAEIADVTNGLLEEFARRRGQ